MKSTNTRYLQTNEGIYPDGTNINQFKKHGSFWLAGNTNLHNLQVGNIFKIEHVTKGGETFGIIKSISESQIEIQLSDGEIVRIIGLILEFMSLAKTLWLTIKAAFGSKSAKAKVKELQKLNQFK